MQMILAIDFDGTIVADEFPHIGEMRAGAKEAINKLHDEGYYIIIWTCRTHARLQEAKQWLTDEGIRYHKINESCPASVEVYSGIDTRKVFANLYIEDRSIHPLPPWHDIYNKIHELLPTHTDAGFP